MKLKKFLAFSFLILLVFSMTAMVTAQPIVDDMEYCITGGPHDMHYAGHGWLWIGGNNVLVDIYDCSYRDYSVYIY